MTLSRSSLNTLLFVFVLTLLLPVAGLASTNQPLVLNADQDHYPLQHYLRYLEDKSGTSSFEEITRLALSSQFKSVGQRFPSFGYTRSVYWTQFTVRNPYQAEQRLLLELAHPFMKRVTLYYSSDGGTFQEVEGGLQKRRTRQEISSRNHIFAFNFKPLSDTRVYMRFENGGPMSFPLSLWDMGAYIAKTDLERIILGLFYGVFFALLVYNFTIFLSLKDKSYLFYVVFLGCMIFYQLSADGIGYQYFWKGNEWFSVNCIFTWNLAIASYLAFSRSFLNVKKHVPRLDKVLLLLIGLVLANILLSQFWDMILSLKISLYSHFIGTFLMIWISILCIRNRSRPAKFYFGAMLLLLVPSLATVLKNAGILPQNSLTTWGIHLGATAEVLLLSVGLADRINTMRNERYQAQKAAVASKQLFIDTLKKAEKRIHQIFNNAVEGIFQFSEEGRLVFANTSMAKIFGYESVVDMLGTITDIKMLFKNHEDYKELYSKMISNQNRIDFEVPFVKKNGELIFGTVSIHRITNASESKTFGEGMILDTTDRRLREKAERDLEIAEQANQAKTDFLASVSHELRSPLHGILGYAKMGISRSKVVPEETVVTYFEKIRSSGQKLTRQLNDLLDLSKLEANAAIYDLQSNRLSDITSSVIDEMDSIIKPKEVSVRFRPPVFNDTAVMDSDKIVQVIRNLIANAIRFANQHDTIDIAIEKIHSEFQFTISDQGIGIPEAEVEQIFEKFFQSSKIRKGDGGTGLGLSISKRIIEDHGGRIWAENNPDRGATFRFCIPESQDSDA